MACTNVYHDAETCETAGLPYVLWCANCTTESQESNPTCLDGPDGCGGKVEYRMPLSSTGKSFPRCDAHWDKRIVMQEETNRKYPVNPPADFDPGYAGESWDDPT